MASDKAGKNAAGEETAVVEVAGVELVARPSGPSAALATAVQRADAYREHTRADATQAAYKADWERFQAWATRNGAVALPAAPAVVAAHLGWLADEGYSVATIERFLAAGSRYHRAVGQDFPRSASAVSETLKGIRRRVGVKRGKKAPLGLKALADICKRLQHEAEYRGEPSVGLSQRALLTVGWFCMLRSANLVAIRREHVRLVRFDGDDWVDDIERPEGLIVHLPGSKTDQLKEGRDVAVPAQAEELVCPVRTLAEYFEAVRFAPDDLIFPISKRTVSRLIKRVVANPEHRHKTLKEIDRCESCAVAARRFASHSLRRGAATRLAQQGVAERDIMRQGGWKNERVMRGYIEHATIFENNPMKGLAKKT